jgi:hypothetical protein
VTLSRLAAVPFEVGSTALAGDGPADGALGQRLLTENAHAPVTN